MDIVKYLTPFLGAWQGQNRLRLMPTDDYKASAATATVTVTAAHFASVAYTWSEGESQQEGLLILQQPPPPFPAHEKAVEVVARPLKRGTGRCAASF